MRYCRATTSILSLFSLVSVQKMGEKVLNFEL